MWDLANRVSQTRLTKVTECTRLGHVLVNMAVMVHRGYLLGQFAGECGGDYALRVLAQALVLVNMAVH